MHGTDRTTRSRRLVDLPHTDPVDDFDPDALDDARAFVLANAVTVSGRIVDAIRSHSYADDRASVLRGVTRCSLLRDLGGPAVLARSGLVARGAARSALDSADAPGAAVQRAARRLAASSQVML